MALTVADFLLWCVRGKYSEHFLVMAVELAGTLAEKFGFIKNEDNKHTPLWNDSIAFLCYR